MKNLNDVTKFLKDAVLECSPEDGCGQCDQIREAIAILEKPKFVERVWARIKVDLEWNFCKHPVTDARFKENLRILQIDIITENVDGDQLILEGPKSSFDIFHQMYYGGGDNTYPFDNFTGIYQIP